LPSTMEFPSSGLPWDLWVNPRTL